MLSKLKKFVVIPLKMFVGLVTITLLIIFLTPLILPVVLYRRFLFHASKILRPDLDKMVNARGTTFLFKNPYEHSHTKVVVGLTLEGLPSKADVIRKFKSVVSTFDKSTAELLYCEMQQEMVCWAGYRFWKNIPNFNVEDYVAYVDESTYTYDQANEAMKEESLKPFQKGKALWSIKFISQYQPNKNAQYYNSDKVYSFLIFSGNHSLFDGFSILNIANSIALADCKVIRDTNINKLKTDSSSKKSLKNFFKLVSRVPYDIGHLVLGLNKVHGIWEEKDVSTYCTQKQDQYIATFSDLMDFSEIKKVSRLHKVSTFAVIAACMCSSIRSVMFDSNKIPSAVNFSFPVPMSNHPLKLRNHVSGATISFPLGVSDPLKRLHNINRNLHNLRSSAIPYCSFVMFILLGSLPPAILNSVYKMGLDNQLVAMSSFPGPSDTLQMFPDIYLKSISWVFSAARGSKALGSTFTTYAGTALLSILADFSVVESDKKARSLIAGFSKELRILLQESLPQNEEIV